MVYCVKMCKHDKSDLSDRYSNFKESLVNMKYFWKTEYRKINNPVI